jgi:hypothetical protein
MKRIDLKEKSTFVFLYVPIPLGIIYIKKEYRKERERKVIAF